jgi:hypothetical protein
MRKLLAASIAALTLLTAGSALAQSAPTLPNGIKPSSVRGLAPNGTGGWDWIVQIDSSDGVLQTFWLGHGNPDGSTDLHRVGTRHATENQHARMSPHRSEPMSVATAASMGSFSSSSHH